jgi:hypothetical protein
MLWTTGSSEVSGEQRLRFQVTSETRKENAVLTNYAPYECTHHTYCTADPDQRNKQVIHAVLQTLINKISALVVCSSYHFL